MVAIGKQPTTKSWDALRHSVAAAPGGASFPRVRGGIDLAHSYPAIRNENGTFKLPRIDIFKACERQKKLPDGSAQTDRFDRQWCEGAVERHGALAKRGYYPPAHIDHHDDKGHARGFAGYITKEWVEDDEDGVATIYAEIDEIPPEVFALMATRRLGYRSIEANVPSRAEISSLAFMDHVVPYHKLPLLNVELVEDHSAHDGTLGFHEQWRKRTCFAEHEPMAEADPKAGGYGKSTTTIIQAFSAPYEPWARPTLIAELVNFAGEDDVDADDYNEFGGADEFGGLSLEDLQALLAAQGGADDGTGDGAGGDMPDDGMGADVDPEIAGLAQEHGVTPEEIMSRLDRIEAAVDSIAQMVGQGGGTQTMPAGPPSLSREEQDAALKFFEAHGFKVVPVGKAKAPTNGGGNANGNGSGKTTDRADRTNAAPTNRNDGVRGSSRFTDADLGVHFDEFNQLKKLLTDDVVPWIQQQRKEQAIAGLWNQIGSVGDRLCYGEDGTGTEDGCFAARGYTDDQISDAAKFANKGLQLDVRRWQDGEIKADEIDVAAHFAEYLERVVPGEKPGGAPIPDSPRHSATPRTNARAPQEILATQFCEQDGDAKAVFGELHLSPKDAPDVAIAIAEAATNHKNDPSLKGFNRRNYLKIAGKAAASA